MVNIVMKFHLISTIAGLFLFYPGGFGQNTACLFDYDCYRACTNGTGTGCCIGPLFRKVCQCMSEPRCPPIISDENVDIARRIIELIITARDAAAAQNSTRNPSDVGK